MSFHRECQKYNNWTLITLGESLSFNSNLAKVTQSGWLGMPTKLSPSLLKELEINQINDQGSSWMKIMSNYAQTLLTVKQTNYFLISWSSWYFLEYYSLLNWCF